MHWLKGYAAAAAMIIAASAYVASEYSNGAEAWKWIASVALSLAGVLIAIIYQDMKREQIDSRREIDELRRQLEKRKR